MIFAQYDAELQVELCSMLATTFWIDEGDSTRELHGNTKNANGPDCEQQWGSEDENIGRVERCKRFRVDVSGARVQLGME